MKNLKTVFATILLLGVSVGGFAQSRQPHESPADPAAASETPVTTGDTGNSSQNPTSKNASSPGGQSPYSYDAFSTAMTAARVELGPGDLIEISVFDTPEMTQRVRVNSEGKITLALIGEITARGISPDILEKIIRQKLVDGNYMKDPQVSVFVLEYSGQMAYVTGEVNHPGAYTLLRSHRLLDLISLAGGLSSRAGNAVTIVRGDDAAQHILVDLGDHDEHRSNPEIFPGDSITVAQTGIVYVLGDVNRPGGFLLDRRTTLGAAQAVALAEGPKDSASLAKSILIHNNQGNRQATPINLKAILKSQNPDILLSAGDIIYVPGSVIHGMGRTTLEVIMSSAGLAAVYATRP